MAALYPILAGAIVIDATNGDLYVGVRSGVIENNITIPAGTYFLRGDDSADDICKAIADELDTLDTLNTPHTVTYAGDVGTVGGTVVIAGAGAYTIALLPEDVSQTFDMALLGFPVTDTAYAGSHTSSLTPSKNWVSSQPTAVSDPDSEGTDGIMIHDTPNNQQYVTIMQSDLLTHELGFKLVAAARTWITFAGSDPAISFQAWRRLHRDGGRFEWHQAAASSGTALATLGTAEGTFVMEADALKFFAPQRREPGVALFNWAVGIRTYVA